MPHTGSIAPRIPSSSSKETEHGERLPLRKLVRQHSQKLKQNPSAEENSDEITPIVLNEIEAESNRQQGGEVKKMFRGKKTVKHEIGAQNHWDVNESGVRKEGGGGKSTERFPSKMAATIHEVIDDPNYSPARLRGALKKLEIDNGKEWMKELKEDEVVSLLEICMILPHHLCQEAATLALNILERLPLLSQTTVEALKPKLVPLYSRAVEARKQLPIKSKDELPQNYVIALSQLFFISDQSIHSSQMYLDLWKRLLAVPHPFLQRLLEVHILYDMEIFQNETTSDRVVFMRLLLKYLSDKMRNKEDFLNSDDLSEYVRIFPTFLAACLQFASDDTPILQRAAVDLLKTVLQGLQKFDDLHLRAIRICAEIAVVILDEGTEDHKGRSKDFYVNIKRSCMRDIVETLIICGPLDEENRSEFTDSTTSTPQKKTSTITTSENIIIINEPHWKMELQRRLEDSVFETGANSCQYELVPFVNRIIDTYKGTQNTRWVEFVAKLYDSGRQSIDPYLAVFFTVLNRSISIADDAMIKAVLDVLILIAKENAQLFTVDQLKEIETLCLTFRKDISAKAFSLLEILSQNKASLFVGKGKGYFAASRPCGSDTQLQVVTILGNIAIHGTKDEALRVVGLMDSEMLPTNNKQLVEAILKAWKRIAVVHPAAIAQYKEKIKEFEQDPALRPAAAKVTEVLKKSRACTLM